MKTYNMEESGARIRALRKRKGLTQGELGDALHLTTKSIGCIERGENGCSIDVLLLLSDYFGVSLDYLICGENYGACDPKTELERAIGILQSVHRSMG